MPATVRDWLHGRQDWLQQAAEILLASGSVSDAQIDELAARIKMPAGQQVTSHRTFAGVTAPAPVNNELRLTSIGEVHGIENLGPPSPLAFGPGNLCVIYGHNASGKSGYVRLLKHVSGKPHTVPLKPNVFQPVPVERRCEIQYAIGGAGHPVTWRTDDPPVDDLRAVDVFDSEASVSYLTAETAASYTPPAVALFEKLAAVCNRVKAKLQAEQSALAKQLPALLPRFVATPAGTAYQRLHAGMDDEAVGRVVAWKPEDDEALKKITERLNVADPVASAHARRNTQNQVTALITSLRAAGDAFSSARLEAIRALHVDATNKRRIANESAQVASAHLDGVGTETWRALWNAARAYSEVVYPGRGYPVTDGARCVLCQQELRPDAQARLHDFDHFVRRRVETEATSAEAAYQQALGAFPAVLTEEGISTRCQAAGLTDPALLTRLGDFWRQVQKAREALLDGEAGRPAIAVASPAGMVAALAKYADELAAEAKQFDDDAKTFDRAKAAKDKLNLEARQWIAQQKDAVRTEVARLRQFAEYETWKGFANSHGVSLQAGEIGVQLVTQAFVDRFNAELKALGASRIKIELQRTRTERGRPLHKLRLKGVQAGQDVPESVLSDGERRIVGLAAFLADVVEKPGIAPFVFDDPISSLDQEYEWKVALRLAELAKTRQVIVFTHRLSLYGAMEDAAQKVGDSWKKQHLSQLCLQSFNGTAGHPVDQAVWNAKTTKANGILLTRLDEASAAGETFGPDAYRNLAQSICSDFRKLLERTIEDDLLSKVVQRHRRSVTTLGRLERLPSITKDDCKFLDAMMSKYSVHEHSQSPEAIVDIPDADDLRQDIQALMKWRTDFNTRASAGSGHA